MRTKYVFQAISSAETHPAGRVGAVFVLALCEDRILAVKNERGWDIPGGHLESGESPLDALKRELAEEAGASVERTCRIGTLAMPGAEEVMLFFAAEGIVLGEFVPKKDALAREVITIDELISRYYGDRDLMRDLIEKARNQLKTPCQRPER